MQLYELTKEQEDAVLKEVGYTRQQLEADLVEIKEWLKEQHHLPPSRLTESDNFLQTYLTGCKGSLNKVKRKLDAYYTARSHMVQFENRDPLEPAYQAVINEFQHVNTRKPSDKTLGFIIIVKLLSKDINRFDLLLCAKKALSDTEILLRAMPVSVRRIIVADGENITANHIMKVTPSLIKDLLHIVSHVLPLRIFKVLFINTPPILETAINNLGIPFLPKKLKDRLHITTAGYEVLDEYVEKKYLPQDLGGDDLDTKQINDLWCQEQIRRREWFLNELSEKCDESKRVNQNDTFNNPYFGVQGSLKKLVID